MRMLLTFLLLAIAVAVMPIAHAQEPTPAKPAPARCRSGIAHSQDAISRDEGCGRSTSRGCSNSVRRRFRHSRKGCGRILRPSGKPAHCSSAIGADAAPRRRRWLAYSRTTSTPTFAGKRRCGARFCRLALRDSAATKALKDESASVRFERRGVAHHARSRRGNRHSRFDEGSEIDERQQPTDRRAVARLARSGSRTRGRPRCKRRLWMPTRCSRTASPIRWAASGRKPRTPRYS